MLFSLSLSAQQQTPNILGTWTGVATGNYPVVNNSGGPGPLMTSNGVVHMSYSQATIAQTIAINNALSGSGIRVSGYDWSWTIRNNDGYYGPQTSGADTLTATVTTKNISGVAVDTFVKTYNTRFDWTTDSGTRTFATPYDIATLGNLSVQFSGRDVGFWAGYYGPQVSTNTVSIKLNYGVDPCVANPLSSSSCPGYIDILTSTPIIQQSYAINQALSLSGANVKIHGFDYGYTTNFGSQPCVTTFLFWCTGWADSTIDVNVVVTDSVGASLYNQTHSHSGADTTQNYSYSYVLPNTKLLSTMGSFSLSASTFGNASISNVWSTWKYTPDPCEVNPLSDPACPNYAVAYHNHQCSMSALFATDCPGYASAYLSQQCEITGQLYSPSCRGYTTAFFNFQCNANVFYSVDCPGYQDAYYDKKCSEDPLYDKGCAGYEKAYAKKYILPTTSTPTVTQTTKTETTESVSETTSPTSPTSVTSVIKAPEAVSTTTVAQTNEKTSEKKTEEPKKETSVAKALAKTSASEKAKELANTMSKAKTMDDQVATQGALVGVMGYVAGFSAYQNAIVPDVMGLQMARKYSKPVVDNRSVQRRMTGASEGLHRQMVEQQYNLGN